MCKFKFSFFFDALLTNVSLLLNFVSMKRIFMALAILSTLTLASCGSGETTESTTTEVVTDTTGVDSTNAECETDSVE
jgi:ABC-type oligopeptide transport system substrate-binding subunit